jgi:calcineurin-like phosphoesterase family protein
MANRRPLAATGTASIAPAKIIVLSDLHMVPPGETIMGIDPYARIKSAISHINKNHADAARVILLGDLVHGGDVASYQRVRELTQQLRPPVNIILGNHDHRQSFWEIFGAGSGTDRFQHEEIQIDAYRLLLLDTVMETPIEGCDHGAAGFLCEQRMGWLDRRLRAAGDDPVVLFMHHPPMRSGFPGMDRAGVFNTDDLLRVLRRHGNVRHIVAGHVHRTISGAWHGIPFAIFKSPVYQQPLDFESHSSALSIDEPGAYGVILLTDAGLIVHTEDFDLAAVRNEEKDMSKLNYWEHKWELDEKQCPCDVHLLDYLADKKRTGIDIFHMGTGSHHVIGLRTATDGSNNHVFGITSSPQEYEDYIKLLIDNPKLGFSYKVYFGDIYQINRRLMPELDVATLFHIGEFRTEHNEAYGALTNVDTAQVLVDRLRPGGELIFYAGSFAYDQAEATIKTLLSRGCMEDAGRYKTLHILRKRRD